MHMPHGPGALILGLCVLAACITAFEATMRRKRAGR